MKLLQYLFMLLGISTMITCFYKIATYNPMGDFTDKSMVLMVLTGIFLFFIGSLFEGLSIKPITFVNKSIKKQAINNSMFGMLSTLIAIILVIFLIK